MAVDTTQSLAIGPTPTEIVATLGLDPGEYRIENSSTLAGPPGAVDNRILFVASAGLLADFPPRGAHGLAPGAREDIGIEAGQRWYFWGPPGSTLVITAAEGGGSIGGSPPVLRLPTFTIDIYRVVPTADGVPATPTGGAWNLRTAQLTPPEDWSATQRPLSQGQTEYTTRALIDPNTQDNIVVPVWQAARRVDLVGTITAVRPTAPLTGGGAAGEVAVGVQTHGIAEDLLATGAVTRRVLADGTAGRLLGFNARGEAAEVAQHSHLSDLDVPIYEVGKILGAVSGAGGLPALGWVNQPTIPDVPRVYLQGAAPGGQRLERDTWAVTADIAGATGVVAADGVTARTRLLVGDWHQWDGAAAGGTGAWRYRGTTAVRYADATRTTPGIMSAADKAKLDAIAAGAEVNVQPDWDAASGDAAILNKPTIPDAPVQSDWGVTDTTSLAHILRKPTSLADFDAPAYTGQDGKVLGLESGALAWLSTGAHRIYIGTGFRSSPDTGEQLMFVGDVTGLTGYVDADGTTARTTAKPGDWARYSGTQWVYEGSGNTVYAEATRTAAGLLSAADKAKLDGIEAGAEENDPSDWDASSGSTRILNKPTIPTIPGAATASANGLMTSAMVTKLASIARGAEVNVQPDWDATSGDAAIQNKPTALHEFDAPAYGGSDGKVLGLASGALAWLDQPTIPEADDPTRVVTALPSDPDAGEQAIAARDLSGLSNVRNADATARTTLSIGDVVEWNESHQRWVYLGHVGRRYHDATTSADGLLSAADKRKLDGIDAGAEVNVQSNWAATSGDAAILNKPTIPTVPGAATASAAGLMSSADKVKLDAIAAGAHVNVQADWEEDDTSAHSYIRRKPTIPAAQVPADWDASSGVARILNKPTIPTIPGVATASANGLMSSAMATKLAAIAAGAEVNVQADWNAASGDAFIRNKPTIPTIPGVATTTTAGLMSAADRVKFNGIAAGAEANVLPDWDATSGASLIENKPTIPTTIGALDVPTYESGRVLGYNGTSLVWVAQHQRPGVATDSAAGLISSALFTKLEGIAEGAEVNVQSDWQATAGDAFILHKPTIPETIRELDVPIYEAGKVLGYNGTALVWVDAPAGSGSGGTSFTPTQGNLYASVKAILVHNSNTGVSANDALNQINIAAGGDSSFSPSKTNLYAAVKSILVHAGNTGVTADDTDSEIDISGTGGSAFLPSPSNTDAGDAIVYFGWASVGAGWLIRRLTLATGALASATAGAANYTAAWSGRGGLTYA